MKRITTGWLAVLLGIAVALSGCVSAPPTTPASPGATTAAATSSADADLQAARKAAGIADCPASSDAPAVDGGLPDITLTCLGGGSTVRMAGLRGPLVINLWAQWCNPCRAEAPHLKEFTEAAGSSVAVMGIDTADPRPDLAIEFAQYAGWTYPQVTDPNRSVLSGLSMASIPVTVFVDADGKVVYRQIGAFGSTDQIKQLVAEHLKVTVP